MKKILGIIVLGLLLSGNAYAKCQDDIELSWKIKDGFVYYEWLNKNNKKIEITAYGLMTKDEQKISNMKGGIIVAKFGRATRQYTVRDININLVEYAFYNCSYL